MMRASWNTVKEADIQDASPANLTLEKILTQLELMTLDEVFRSSKRSIAFLKYVVNEALNGNIKLTEAGHGQVEMVVPVRPDGSSASRPAIASWLRKHLAVAADGDAWLRKYRDTRHTGVCEGRFRLTPNATLDV